MRVSGGMVGEVLRPAAIRSVGDVMNLAAMRISILTVLLPAASVWRKVNTAAGIL